MVRFRVGDRVRFKDSQRDYVRQWKCPDTFEITRADNDHRDPIVYWGEDDCPGAFMSWLEPAEGPW